MMNNMKFKIKHPKNDTKTSLERLCELREERNKTEREVTGYYLTDDLMIGCREVDVVQDLFDENVYVMRVKYETPIGDVYKDRWFSFNHEEVEDCLKENLLRFKEYLKELDELTDEKLRDL